VSETIAPSGHFVQSLSRGLAVIRALNSPEPMTLSEVARASELSRATSRRFVLTLEALGYVTQRGARFALTPRVLELGFAYLSALGLPDVAQPHLERLVEQVRESSSVSVLDGESVVYVARVPTRRIMNVVISVGTRFPAYATSMGRVLLSGLDPQERAALLDQLELVPLAHETITTRAQLEAELARARAGLRDRRSGARIGSALGRRTDPRSQPAGCRGGQSRRAGGRGERRGDQTVVARPAARHGRRDRARPGCRPVAGVSEERLGRESW
jgi:IclR family transcriptional regulator, pca regulon regulatory protein